MQPALETGTYQPASATSFGSVPMAERFGAVRTSLERGRQVVWLEGEIDLALAAVLAGLVVHARDLGFVVVLDCSRLTFCDCTLANFISALSDQVVVELRQAPSPLVDLLMICGLTDRAQQVQ